MGVFLLKKHGEQGDMEGGWLGYYTPNATSFGMGKYAFKRTPEIAINPVNHRYKHWAHNLALQVSGNDPEIAALLNASKEEGTVSAVAILRQTLDLLNSSTNPGNTKVGFVIGRLLVRAELTSGSLRNGASIPEEIRVLGDDSIVGLLQTVVVHPDYQGRGVGTALVRHAKQQMARLGAEILVAIAPNGEAAGFFTNLEFTPCCGDGPAVFFRCPLEAPRKVWLDRGARALGIRT